MIEPVKNRSYVLTQPTDRPVFEPTRLTKEERNLATEIIGEQFDKQRQAQFAAKIKVMWETLQTNPSRVGPFLKRLGTLLKLDPAMTWLFITDKIANITGLEPAELVYWAKAYPVALSDFKAVTRPPVVEYMLHRGRISVPREEAEKASRIIGDPSNETRQRALRFKMLQVYQQTPIHSSVFLARLQHFDRTYTAQFIDDKLQHGTQQPVELVHWAKACGVDLDVFKM